MALLQLINAQTTAIPCQIVQSPPNMVAVPVRIYDPENNIVSETNAMLTPAGTFSGQFDIADDVFVKYSTNDD